MTDTTKDNTKPLIDTEETEEQQVSLVSSEPQHDHHVNNLIATDNTATLATNVSSEWDEETNERAEPSAVVAEEYEKDPWAQPENALLTQNDTLEEEEEEEGEEGAEEEQRMLEYQEPQQQQQHQRQEPPAIATTSVFDEYGNAQTQVKHTTREGSVNDKDTSAAKVT